MDYSPAFLAAVNHAMLYEVGGFWSLTSMPDEVAQGLCDTPAQARAVGYTVDPNDPGGETKFGIAKNANPDVDIRALDWAGACAIYYRKYWCAGSCDKMSPRLSVLQFDGCVNNGVGRASMFLQRAVGTTPDGSVGPATLAKTAALDELTVCNSICDIRSQFYRDLVTAKPNLGMYLAGWLRRTDEMRSFVSDPSQTFS